MNALLIAAALLTLPLSQSAQPQASQDAQLTVIGEGLIKATPDRAVINVGVESRSKVSKDAQQRNAEVMTSVMQAVSRFGIDKDAVQTTAVDLQLEFDYADGKQTPRGYVARNTIEVRVDDLAKLGDVLDAVVRSGATMIHGLRFDVKLRDQLEASALASAVKVARAKADALARAAGRSVERIVKIEELSGLSDPVPMMRQFAMAAKADASTPVAPGEIEIRAQVRLTAQMK